MLYIRSDLPSINSPLAKDIGYGQPFSYSGSIYMRTKCDSQKVTQHKSKEFIAAVNLKLGNTIGIDRCASVTLIKVAICDVEGEWQEDHRTSVTFLKFHPFEPIENNGGKC